ncbi:MAG: hypothetical protein U0183_01375 [Polyangiaceae bacterium]
MSQKGDREQGSPDLSATEEMPSAGALSSRRRLNAEVPAPRPSEPVQLASGQSSGESQAAYATGPKNIPPSRQNLGSDPAPAVIVEGAQAHTYAPLDPPPSSGQGGLYMAPPPAIAAPQSAIPQFVSPPPRMRPRSRSDTVLITMPGKKAGPSSKEKVLAFVVMLVIVVLLGTIFLLFSGLRGRSEAAPPAPEPGAVATAESAPAAPTAPPKAPEAQPVSPPVVVVAAPALMDAGAKKPPKKHAP